MRPTPDGVPALFQALFDDAAMFPPARTPIRAAVRAYAAHRAAPYAAVVGPFVLAGTDLPEASEILAPGARMPAALTFPAGPSEVGRVLDEAAAGPVEVRAVEVRAVEVAVPPAMSGSELLSLLGPPRAEHPEVVVYVEIPRDLRRDEVIRACAEQGVRAKFRTGGTAGATYPGEAELAEWVFAAVTAGVAFKATAGLHHAVRNTDPDTGFEQHGFLNLLLAADAALDGADRATLQRLLASRDGEAVAAATADLGDGRIAVVRAGFVSLGTCSIADPVGELTALGLLDLTASTAGLGTR